MNDATIADPADAAWAAHVATRERMLAPLMDVISTCSRDSDLAREALRLALLCAYHDGWLAGKTPA